MVVVVHIVGGVGSMLLKRVFCNCYLTGTARLILSLYYCKCCNVEELSRLACMLPGQVAKLLSTLMVSGIVRACGSDRYCLSSSGVSEARRIIRDLKAVVTLLEGVEQGDASL